MKIILSQCSKILREGKLVYPRRLCETKRRKIDISFNVICEMLGGFWYVELSTLKRFTAPSERFKGFSRQLFFYYCIFVNICLVWILQKVLFSLSQQMSLLLKRPRLNRFHRLLGRQNTLQRLRIRPSDLSLRASLSHIFPLSSEILSDVDPLIFIGCVYYFVICDRLLHTCISLVESTS